MKANLALKAGAAVAAGAALLALANLVAGWVLFLSYGEHPAQADFLTIEQAYQAAPDGAAMRRVKGSAAVALLLCFGLPGALLLKLRRREGSTQFGKARFANGADIAREGLNAERGIVIGKFGRRLLRLDGYDFVLLAAPTRTGKGVGFCVPNLLQFQDSAVVLDIKGESHTLTSEFRRRYLGNTIYYFNPYAEHTHRWNPLSYVSADPNFRASDLLALASIIYPPNDRDPFWPDSARNLFVGLGLLVLETPELPATMGEILRQGSGKGYPLADYLEHVLAVRAAGPQPLSAACRDSLNRFLNSGETALKGIVATFSAALTPFGNAVVDKATSADDFDLREVRKKKMTVYLHIPAGEILQAGFIVNLFFSQLINENVKELPEHNPALRHQCLLLMDEFTAMGKVAILAKGVGYMAGYNMRLAIVIQDKAQLDAVYGKEDAHNIVSNMGAVIYFTPSQVSEAEEYSRMIGNDTVTSVSTQQAKGTLFGVKGESSRTASYQSRAVMLPQELLGMSKDTQLVVRSGIPVIRCSKIRYFDDPYFKERYHAVPMQSVTIGGARRQVPLPARLPVGDWAAYHASIAGSEHYIGLAPGLTSGLASGLAPDSPAPAPAPWSSSSSSASAAGPSAAIAAVPPEPTWRRVPPAVDAYAAIPAVMSTAVVAPVAVAERAAEATPPSVRTAHAYADGIVRFWQAAQAAGALDADLPLTVLDLHPGDGSFCWQLIVCLRQRLDGAAPALPPFQYLACVDDVRAQGELMAHPYFNALAQDGSFLAILRDEALAQPRAWFASQPVVALACGWMASLEQHMLPPDDDGDSVALPPLSASADAMREAYRHSLHGAAAALPAAAIDAIDALVAACDGHCLLLASDYAIGDERDIRQGAYRVGSESALPAPVNYHALAWHARSAGAHVWQENGAGGATVTLAALFGGQEDVLRGLLPALSGAHGADPEWLLPPAAPALRGGLALLQQAQYDPRCLHRLMPALLAADWRLPGPQLEQWQQALLRVWGLCLPLAGNDGFLLDLAALALRAGHYGLAREAAGNTGDTSQALQLLAQAASRTGDTQEALAVVRMAQELAPQDAALPAMRDELERRWHAQQACGWFLPALAQSGKLRLEPLAGHHAEALLRQLRGGEAGAWPPAVGTLAEVGDWIAAQAAEPAHMSCAILHDDWGCVGVASVRMLAGAGSFSLWIGADYRGRGYAVEGGTAHLLMLRDGIGLQEFFAACAVANRRAVHALRLIGFRPVDAASMPSGADTALLYIGAERDDAVLRPRLEKLCATADTAPARALPA